MRYVSGQVGTQGDHWAYDMLASLPNSRGATVLQYLQNPALAPCGGVYSPDTIPAPTITDSVFGTPRYQGPLLFGAAVSTTIYQASYNLTAPATWALIALHGVHSPSAGEFQFFIAKNASKTFNGATNGDTDAMSIRFTMNGSGGFYQARKRVGSVQTDWGGTTSKEIISTSDDTAYRNMVGIAAFFDITNNKITFLRRWNDRWIPGTRTFSTADFTAWPMATFNAVGWTAGSFSGNIDMMVMAPFMYIAGT